MNCSTRRHLLGIDSLTKEGLYTLLDQAESFVEIAERDIKKVPSLRGKTVINLFLEPSTRTRASFEIAGKRLSADTINLSSSGSSVSKGENLLDTARTLQSMAPDVLVVRHRASGAAHFLASHLNNTSVVNAGDGMHEHPTQALLDCLSLRQHFAGRSEGIEKLKIAFVGDVFHSRVARSNILAHNLLGNEVRLVGPPTLVPNALSDAAAFGTQVKIFHDLRAGLEEVDVVMCLRMQLERQNGNFVPSIEEYSREFCVGSELLDSVAPQAIVLHAGPINRGIEITGELADSSRSLIEKQVENGVAVRMAVLFELATCNKELEAA